jgi:hypothetical protein
MGKIGKVLLFFNLLAAGGLFYLATQSWAKRQDIATTVLHYNLIPQGLPLTGDAGSDDGDIPFRVQQVGGVTTESVSRKFLNTYFGQAAGGPTLGGADRQPVSQVEEVKRVQQKLTGGPLGPGAAPGEKLAFLCGRFGQPAGGGVVYVPGVLAKMAESYDERTLVRRMAAPRNNEELVRNVETATAMLDKRFAAALAEPNPRLAGEEAERVKAASEAVKTAADAAKAAAAKFEANRADQAAFQDLTAKVEALRKAQADQAAVYADLGTAAARDDGDRRGRIAHLLLHLDTSADWQKRVGLVVGLRQYLKAVARQVDRYREMTRAADSQAVLDQAAFSEEYALLQQLAIERALLLERQLTVTADLRAQRAKDLEHVTQRRLQVARRAADLDALKKEVGEALAAQARVEAALFDTQKKAGELLQRNFDLEAQLAAAEKKADGGAGSSGAGGQ